MPKRTIRVAIGLWLMAVLCGTGRAETPEEVRDRVLAETKLNAVFVEGRLGDFVQDGDPQTLEVVFLEKKADGPSRVTEDGQVIFLYKASEDQQQELIQKALEIRIAKATAGT